MGHDMDFNVALLNSFNLPSKHQVRLKSYFVLHWQMEYLLRKLDDKSLLVHDGITYIPVFQFKFHHAYLSRQLRLSFRETANADEPNYVLIKLLGE